MDINILRREYNQRKDLYGRLKDEVIFILEHELKGKGIPVHQLTGRVKTFESFINKIRRQQCVTPFDSIFDLCGIRIICMFLSDLIKIDKIIEGSFAIDSKDDKIFGKPEEMFGYMSIHYVVTLPEACSGPRYDQLKELKFEIQLRTIAMHAWATIAHYLDYKSPLDVPAILRKDFNALSALFYIADSHFEVFYHDKQRAKEAARQKSLDMFKFGKEEINLDTLSVYLRVKYPDRNHAEPRELSGIVGGLRTAGYSKIEQLDATLQKSEKAFEAFEKETWPGESRPFWDRATVSLSLCIADPKFVTASRCTKLERDEFKKLRVKYKELLSQ